MHALLGSASAPALEHTTTESPARRNSSASALPTPALDGQYQTRWPSQMVEYIALAPAVLSCEHKASPFVLPVMTTLKGGVSSLACRRAAGALTLVWDRAVQAGLSGRAALQ